MKDWISNLIVGLVVVVVGVWLVAAVIAASIGIYYLLDAV